MELPVKNDFFSPVRVDNRLAITEQLLENNHEYWYE